MLITSKLVPDVVLITIDSLRWDVFNKAKLPFLKEIVPFKRSHSHGTYTFVAHQSIFQGILPHCHDNVDYFNRFKKQLFRIDHSHRPNQKALINFEIGTKNLAKGFQQKGHITFGTGAVGWFRSKVLTEDFDFFKFTGINIKKQQRAIKSFLHENMDRSKFVFWNIGETHDPFEYGSKVEETNFLRNNMRSGHRFSKDYFNELFAKQLKCIEYIESYIEEIFHLVDSMSDYYCIIICADHGTCFGEDNCFGHGFYHPSVMEVPLGIYINNTC